MLGNVFRKLRLSNEQFAALKMAHLANLQLTADSPPGGCIDAIRRPTGLIGTPPVAGCNLPFASRRGVNRPRQVVIEWWNSQLRNLASDPL
jgi:hypothetical protein